jgi:hypothetical protein
MCTNKTYSTVWTDKLLLDMFPFQNGLRQADASLQLLFNFVREYAIRKLEENWEELKLNGPHQLLACADDAEVQNKNINTSNKTTEDVLHARKEVCVQENGENYLHVHIL